MNLLSNLFKSTILATFIFWVLAFSKTFETDMLLFVIISGIPVFICCVLVISFTIYPFFRWFEKNDVDKKAVFNTVFPYYSTVHLGICIYFIVVSNFKIYVVAFFIASFITTSYSWIWFSKDDVS